MPLTVFDSATYNDFAPISEGVLNWIYQMEERQSESGVVHGTSFTVYENTYFILRKIAIDSIWNDNDSLFFKVTSKKYNRSFHGNLNTVSTDTSYLLPNVDTSFIAIYSHNVFYQIDDSFLSKFFSFRNIKRPFTPCYNDSILIDSLKIESNQTVRMISGNRSNFDNDIPTFTSSHCTYTSDVGLLEYNLSKNETIDQSKQLWNFNLIRVQFWKHHGR